MKVVFYEKKYVRYVYGEYKKWENWEREKIAFLAFQNAETVKNECANNRNF